MKLEHVGVARNDHDDNDGINGWKREGTAPFAELGGERSWGWSTDVLGTGYFCHRP